MPIYLDVVMGLNFVVDLLLLLGTNRLAGFPPSGKRTVLSAALGGLYGGACLVPGFYFLGNLLWRTVSLGLMGMLAFGWGRSAWKRCGIFVILTMALGGLALSIGRNHILSLVLCAVGLWGLCYVAFGGRLGGREFVPLTIRQGGISVTLTALRDSGNTLRDPVSGEQVLVIGPEAACRLTGLTQKQLAQPLETLAEHPVPGLRLIPYRAVGQNSGVLLALRFQEVTLGEETGPSVVAFAPAGLGKGMEYGALAGGSF